MPKKNNPFKSPILQAKCVVDMVNFSQEFREKAEKYDELNTQLETNVALHHTPKVERWKKQNFLSKSIWLNI